MIKQLPSVEILEKYFYYDETSITCLRWKLDRPGNINKDDVAGFVFNKYCKVKLLSNTYRLHRIIWKLYYKIEPPEIIDHIDGDTRNNKISNLRAASPKQNCLNIKIPKHNTTGCIGVYWMKNKNKWKVEIKTNDGKLKYFGSFSDFDKAKEISNLVRNNLYGEWIRK